MGWKLRAIAGFEKLVQLVLLLQHDTSTSTAAPLLVGFEQVRCRPVWQAGSGPLRLQTPPCRRKLSGFDEGADPTAKADLQRVIGELELLIHPAVN